jgi:hypothetical protein
VPGHRHDGVRRNAGRAACPMEPSGKLHIGDSRSSRSRGGRLGAGAWGFSSRAARAAICRRQAEESFTARASPPARWIASADSSIGTAVPHSGHFTVALLME